MSSTFFIRIANGKPVGDPMPYSSAQAVGFFEHNLEGGEIPSDLEPFKPKSTPDLAWDEVAESDGELHKIDGQWQRTFFIRPMNSTELEAYKVETERFWREEGCNYKSWGFSSETGQMVPPSQPPLGLKNIIWDEKSKSWSGDPLEDKDAKII